MYERNLDPDVADIVSDILISKNIKFSMNPTKTLLKSDLPRRDYDKVVDLALCRKQQGTSNIPVLSLDMLKTMHKKGESPTHYVLLSRDVTRFMLEGGVDGRYNMCE